MSAEGPPDNAESRWNRAASNLPPKGLVIKVLVVGTVVAIVLLGLSAWSAFDAMKRISDEYGRLAIIANTVENCDTEELSTEASGTSLAMPSMESGQVPDGIGLTSNCPPYGFRITTVYPNEPR